MQIPGDERPDLVTINFGPPAVEPFLEGVLIHDNGFEISERRLDQSDVAADFAAQGENEGKGLSGRL